MSRRPKVVYDRQFLKDRLIRRDGNLCALCGEPMATMRDITMDHIIPTSRGGQTVIENLQLAHPRCNRSKDDMTPEEWAQFSGLDEAAS